MNITETRAYQTSDGQLFSNVHDANLHEFKITIINNIRKLFDIKDFSTEEVNKIIDRLSTKKAILTLLDIFNGVDADQIKKFYKNRKIEL